MFQFEVEGNPVPQQQTRFKCLGSGKHIAYNPNSKDIERFQWNCRSFAPETPLLGPISLSIVFYLPIPKSTAKARRRQMEDRIMLPIGKPDEDNLAYLVTNALKGIYYKDDAQICQKIVHKFYSDRPRTFVTVKKIETCAIYSLEECDIDEADL